MDKPLGAVSGLEALGTDKFKTEAKAKELGQDEFFELMITQLKNQDPMNPMESGDFLAQIAQFSTVNGINQLNESFSSLASTLQSNQALQASTMVGRSVLIDASVAPLAGPGASIEGVIELPEPVGNLTLTVSDAAGQIVRTLPLGGQSGDEALFKWDGLDDGGAQAPAGAYQLRAVAVIDGEEQALNTQIQAKVESVSLPRLGEAPVLNIEYYGPAALDSVKQIM
ncbi:MAG: flagellar hook assembly protein FlgD [Gammaproteobacteria bacterium]|nr:flagellar hook assembly protein FlgD [Gammaproteobacteria bacterium]